MAVSGATACSKFMFLTEVLLFQPVFVSSGWGLTFSAVGTPGKGKQPFMPCGALEAFCLCSLGGTVRLAQVFRKTHEL